MKNICLVISGLVLGVVSQVSSASPNEVMGFDARVGMIFPSKSADKILADKSVLKSKNFFAVGATYTVGKLALDAEGLGQSSWGISADYSGDGNRYNIPLLINYIGRSGQFGYSLGAGIGFGRGYDIVTESLKTKTNFSYQLSGRYYFQETSSTPVFLEARYYGSTKTELSGIAAMIGISL